MVVATKTAKAVDRSEADQRALVARRPNDQDQYAPGSRSEARKPDQRIQTERSFRRGRDAGARAEGERPSVPAPAVPRALTYVSARARG